MGKIIYPLEQVLEVKNRRVEDAERVVKEKRTALEKEQEKLKKCEEERDKVRKHYKEKLQQLRELLDGETTSPKIQQMKAYLKVAEERLKVEEKKVKDQKEQVDLAEKALNLALSDLKQRRLEADKLATHRKDWNLMMKKELEIEEERQQDELGSVIYITKQRQALDIRSRTNDTQ